MATGRGSLTAFGALLVLLSLCLGCSAYCSEIAGDPLVTNEVTFDISIGGESVGSIKFGVFFNLAPKTVLNFISLCAGNTTNNETGQALTYVNSIFHRTIARFMIQGGDIENRNGWGSRSIYGGNFDDEDFRLIHHDQGWIGMANAGPNTNGCQIYITCAPTPWLDCQHVIFGKVIAGMDVVRKIEYNPTNKYDRPLKPVVITGCASVVLAEPYTVTKTPVEG